MKKKMYFALGSLVYFSCVSYKQVLLGLLFNRVSDNAENLLGLT
jgi:hypothetical protein